MFIRRVGKFVLHLRDEWVEGDHPREPAGTSEGGQFLGGGGGGGGVPSPPAHQLHVKVPGAKIKALAETASAAAAAHPDKLEVYEAADKIKALAGQYQHSAISTYANTVLQHLEQEHGLAAGALGKATKAAKTAKGGPVAPAAPTPPAEPEPAPAAAPEPAAAEPEATEPPSFEEPDFEPEPGNAFQNLVYGMATIGKGSPAEKAAKIGELLKKNQLAPEANQAFAQSWIQKLGGGAEPAKTPQEESYALAEKIVGIGKNEGLTYSQKIQQLSAIANDPATSPQHKDMANAWMEELAEKWTPPAKPPSLGVEPAIGSAAQSGEEQIPEDFKPDLGSPTQVKMYEIAQGGGSPAAKIDAISQLQAGKNKSVQEFGQNWIEHLSDQLEDEPAAEPEPDNYMKTVQGIMADPDMPSDEKANMLTTLVATAVSKGKLEKGGPAYQAAVKTITNLHEKAELEKQAPKPPLAVFESSMNQVLGKLQSKQAKKDYLENLYKKPELTPGQKAVVNAKFKEVNAAPETGPVKFTEQEKTEINAIGGLVLKKNMAPHEKAFAINKIALSSSSPHTAAYAKEQLEKMGLPPPPEPVEAPKTPAELLQAQPELLPHPQSKHQGPLFKIVNDPSQTTEQKIEALKTYPTVQQYPNENTAKFANSWIKALGGEPIPGVGFVQAPGAAPAAAAPTPAAPKPATPAAPAKPVVPKTTPHFFQETTYQAETASGQKIRSKLHADTERIPGTLHHDVTSAYGDNKEDGNTHAVSVQMQKARDVTYAQMSSVQVSAMNHYKGSDYDPINDYLRGKDKTTSPTVMGWIKNIRAAMAKAVVPADTPVYRGLRASLETLTGFDDDRAIGRSFVHKNFASVSRDINVAKSFGSFNNTTTATTMVHVTVPAGTPGIVLGHQMNSENEIVLPDHCVFKIDRIEKHAHGPMKHTIHCTYMGRQENIPGAEAETVV